MAKVINASNYKQKHKKKGLAAKNSTSSNKSNKNYKKAYKGQGR